MIAANGGSRMSRLQWPYIALATLVVAGCGAGGLNFWLYPGPHLAESEEALFVAAEGHQLQSIDGEETASRCWGQREPQAYSQRSVLCRLHIRPGQHSVVFHPNVASRERVTLDFTALPGKVYGLDWSLCSTSAEGRRQSCRVQIVEIEQPAKGGLDRR